MPNRRYEQLDVGQLAEELEKSPIVYLPVGSLEYHGLHLPVGFDAIHAHRLCLAAAERSGGVVLPPTFWGTCGHEGFAGSLLLPKPTIAALISDALDELIARGYKVIVLLTGHYPEEQGGVLRQVADQCTKGSRHVRIVVPNVFDEHPVYLEIPCLHAGKRETSIGLHLFPELVHMEGLEEPGGQDAITPGASEATAEWGQELFETSVEYIAELVDEALQQVTAED